jgi:hypothetical protein
MVNTKKLPELLILILCFLPFLISCGEKTCEDVFYEVQGLELIPRKADQPTLGHAAWRNEDQLAFSSLRLKLQMFKPILSGGGDAMTKECRPNFINTNPGLEVTLISNKDYNAQYPAGSNLIPLIGFTLFDTKRISENQFLESQFNKTSWNYYYLEFKNAPAKKDLHTLVLKVSLSNGTELRSPATDVLLRP